jgi:hypothetical protein
MRNKPIKKSKISGDMPRLLLLVAAVTYAISAGARKAVALPINPYMPKY